MGNLGGKSWAPFAAAGPALLSFVLFYLDNGLTWHLIYNPGNNLQHGESYNWDLFLNGFVNMVNGFLGLPWLVATTVPCIVHLNNLADKDSNGVSCIMVALPTHRDTQNFLTHNPYRFLACYSYRILSKCKRRD